MEQHPIKRNWLQRLLFSQKIPVSGRSGEVLSALYGYDGLDGFAGSLPSKAQIADFGAGISPFGRQVCELRDDITWFNVDFAYGDRKLLSKYRHVFRNPPANLHFVAANILKLKEIDQEIDRQRLDRANSYYMLPYITLADRREGLTAARNMLEFVKTTGSVAVGPQWQTIGSEPTMTARLSDYHNDLEPLAERMVSVTTPGRVIAWSHRLPI